MFRVSVGDETGSYVPSSPLLNQFFSFFAEFVWDDLSSVVSGNVNCECRSTNPECFNIPLYLEEQILFNRKCFQYARSLDSAEAFDCVFDHREQLSETSHWLDLSNLYGSNEAQAKLFRTYKNGKLKNDIVSRTLSYLRNIMIFG